MMNDIHMLLNKSISALSNKSPFARKYCLMRYDRRVYRGLKSWVWSA